MRKISVSSSKGLLLNYSIRIIILSLVSILATTAIFSFISLKLDLNESYFKYISIICVSLSSIIVSYFSVKPFKNNGFVLGLISTIPMIVYSLINLLVFKGNIVFFLIKLFITFLLGGLIGYYSIKKSKKIRVK